jgi:23S rRNA (uracil1939-C5)-methyltransferase
LCYLYFILAQIYELYFVSYLTNKKLGRKRKKNIILEKIELNDAGSLGKAISKSENQKVIFTKFGVPGDIVDIQVKKKRKSYIEGEIIKFHTYSKKRENPKCSYFQLCGGCSWQNMKYEDQLIYKSNEVKNNLSRIAKVIPEKTLPIIKSNKEYYYRNKMEFSFSNSRWITEDEINSKNIIENKNALGFHKSGMWSKVIDIDKCYLQTNISNKIRNFIKEKSLEIGLDFFDLRNQSGDLRTLMIRTTTLNEIMILIQFYKNSKKVHQLLNEIQKKFPEITSIMYVINSKKNDTIYDLKVKCFNGVDFISEKIGNLKFSISAKSFFQTNSYQTKKLYNVVKKFASLKGNETIYDLYCGTGTISIFLSKFAKEIIGIETVKDAVLAAKDNAKLNKINNTKFIHGDVKHILSDGIKYSNDPDVIILDPPRNGLEKQVISSVISLKPKKIIYVSCNSSTQARDLIDFKEFYKIKLSQPIDMFPQTYHVENVVLLEKI